MDVLYHETFPEQRFAKLYDKVSRKIVTVPIYGKYNDRYRARLVRRYVKQAQIENVTSYDLVNELGWDLYKKTLRSVGVPYKSFRQRDDVNVVLSQLGSKMLPRNPSDLADMIDHLILWSMPGRRYVRGSHKFGGKYAGTGGLNLRENRRIKLDEFATDKYIEKVLSDDGIRWYRNNDTIYIDEPWSEEEGERYMKSRFISWR